MFESVDVIELALTVRNEQVYDLVRVRENGEVFTLSVRSSYVDR